MSKSIVAVLVPVPPAVPVPIPPLPEFWAVTYTYGTTDDKREWAYPTAFRSRKCAERFAACRANAVIFRLRGNERKE